MTSLESLFKNLSVAHAERKDTDQGSVVVVHLESMSQADLINCVIEIPIDKAEEYGVNFE